MAALGWLLNLGFAAGEISGAEPPTAMPLRVVVLPTNQKMKMRLKESATETILVASQNSVVTE